jgi:hypothetical protein
MKLTIDASVFVSAAGPSENQYPISYRSLLICLLPFVQQRLQLKIAFVAQMPFMFLLLRISRPFWFHGM